MLTRNLTTNRNMWLRVKTLSKVFIFKGLYSLLKCVSMRTAKGYRFCNMKKIENHF